MTVLAADVGGTKTAAARVAATGAVLGAVRTAATPASGGTAAVVASLVGLLRAVRQEAERGGGDPPAAVGLSSAGVVDPRTGTVVAATSSIRGWAGTPLRALVEEALGLPVRVLGDGQATAVGEARYGAARGVASAVVLAVGTGVGGAYTAGGRPLLGDRGAAGHFGHLPCEGAAALPCYCGATGHLEAVASGAGALAAYHRRGGDPSVAGAGALAARAGADPLAAEVLVAAGAALGAAAAGLANALDPSVVVVAGGLTGAGAPWRGALERGYAHGLMPALRGLPLVVSAPGAHPALRGAAAWARDGAAGAGAAR